MTRGDGTLEFDEVVELVGKAIDAIGVAILVIGGVGVLLRYLFRVVSKRTDEGSYRKVRQDLGRAILLGLEFLIVGDIIRTVATTPTFTNVAVLGVIVLIRTFLSVALEVELEGRWPWQKAATPRGG